MTARLLLLLPALALLCGCPVVDLTLACDADTASPGERISVTAWHAADSSNKPAFVIRPADGGAGEWTMAPTGRTLPPVAVEYRGEFVATSPGRLRLEAVLGGGAPAATCDVTVHPRRLALADPAP